MTLDNGMRWLTVRPQGSTGQELLLMDPAHSTCRRPSRCRRWSRREAEPRRHGHDPLPGEYATLIEASVEFTALLSATDQT